MYTQPPYLGFNVVEEVLGVCNVYISRGVRCLADTNILLQGGGYTEYEIYTLRNVDNILTQKARFMKQ